MQGEKQRTKQKRARQLASDPRADRGGAAAPPADVAADTNAAGSASNTLDSAPSADLPNRGSKRPARRKNTPSYQLDEVWEEESEEEEEEEEESDEGATLVAPQDLEATWACACRHRQATVGVLQRKLPTTVSVALVRRPCV